VPSFFNDLFLIEYDKQGNYINQKLLERGANRFSNQGSFIQRNELIWCNGDAETDSGFHTLTLAYNLDGDLIHRLGFEGSFQNLFYLNDSLVCGYFCQRKWVNGEIEKTCYMAIYDGNDVVNLNIEEFHFPTYIDGSIYLIDNSNNDTTILKRLNSDRIIDSVYYFEKINFEWIHQVQSGIILYGRMHNTSGNNVEKYCITYIDNYLNLKFSIKNKIDEVMFIDIIKNIDNFPLVVITGVFDTVNQYSYTVLNKLFENGEYKRFFNYSNEQKVTISFSPFVQTFDGGFWGTAYHWNSPYQFNIMKTDSLGRLYESDYLGGITFTGVLENEFPENINHISLYPNPNIGQFRIGNEESGVVEVYNLRGQRIYAQLIVQTNEFIQLGQVPTGVYLLRFIQENGTVKNAKFVVE
jgi:hypothetical protein